MEPSDATSPSFPAHMGPGNIRTLIFEKEKELHDINEYRIRTLEVLLRDKETATSAAKQKLSKLHEDFKYNLKLLEGRDEELALYDANFVVLKNVLRDREIELSESKAREAEVQAEVKQCKQKASDLEVLYQQQLKDARAQMEGAKWTFDDELRRQEEATATLRRTLEKQLREKEDDMDTQRRDMTVTFDDITRQREMAFKQTSEELKGYLRALEVKNKALARDADGEREQVEKLKIKNLNLQHVFEEKEKEVKSFEWTIAEMKSINDVKIGELENKVAKLNEVKQNLLMEYESKMAELVQSLHAVEKAFVHQKTQFEAELEKVMEQTKSEADEATERNESKVEALTARLRERDETVEGLQAELKLEKRDAEERVMESEREVERWKSTVQELEEEHRRATMEMQKQLRAGDRETQRLQERLHEMQRQVALLKEKDMAQRHELLESIEKQEELQRELVSVHSRWEKQWQEQQQELDERYAYQIRDLKQGKERLGSQKKAVEDRLAHAEKEVHWLRLEVTTLKSKTRISRSFGSAPVDSTRRSGEAHHSSDAVPVAPSPLWSDDPGTLSPVPGMSPLLTDSPHLRGRTMASTRASALELENAKLRDIIRQMKESLAHQADEMEASPGHDHTKQSASDRAAQLEKAQERCGAFESKLNDKEREVTGLTLQLESCKQELLEARREIEVKSTRIAELEARIRNFEEARMAEAAVQGNRGVQEAQVTELKRKLEGANADIDRLVRERSQLMELSNQLRADLRRSGSETGSNAPTPRVEVAGKRDYETLITDLTQSLEAARGHNKTLKKELRRMVKAHVHLQDGQSDDKDAKRSQIDPERRRSSTLSMMKSLNPDPARPKPTLIRSVFDRETIENPKKQDLDEELLTFARNNRPRASSQATETRDEPSVIRHQESESDVTATASGEYDVKGERVESAKSPLAKLFQTAARAETETATASNTSAKVTDARLKLQQAKEMLLLSGKRAPVAGSRATLSAQTAIATRVSDRATSSQRSAVKKLKQRAEMVNERKKVRNYSLA